ncbi:hypothetical protein POREN0001_0804 [Porphyromonas endodontalis ATCC 35406]|uniref:Uncharacterized protein n=1 Tax=Porphyromonas endodontalis (strain ATCC 35406 / DSM 24491 / JCM 8526 / CCUG 16442 / BCRC 14492 / NCTC 13058 / HG 370) TaxID=553175 RepID=C3J9Q3_POREA|nr:hypothetical protein POREN0001_0804 [Porphyromonas endodontalis ATCC 35406]
MRQARQRPGKAQQIDKKQVYPARENHLFLPFLGNKSKEPHHQECDYRKRGEPYHYRH